MWSSPLFAYLVTGRIIYSTPSAVIRLFSGVSTLTIAGPIPAQRSGWVRRETNPVRTPPLISCRRGSRFGASHSASQPGDVHFDPSQPIGGDSTGGSLHPLPAGS